MTDKILCIGGPLSGRTVSKKTDFSHSVPHYDRTVIPDKGPAQKMRIEQVRYVLKYWSFPHDPAVPFFAPETQTYAETFRLLMLGFQHVQRSNQPDWAKVMHRNNVNAQVALYYLSERLAASALKYELEEVMRILADDTPVGEPEPPKTEAQQVLQEILSPETPAHVTASKAAQLLANGYSITGLVLTRDDRKCTIDCGKAVWMECDEQHHAAR